MVEWNSYYTHNIYSNLSATPLKDRQQFRLREIKEIKDYFVAEIKERELMRKRLSKHIASFDYFDKSLIVLSVTNWQHFYCIICNYYWSTCRNGECGFWSRIFGFYRSHTKAI